MNNNPFQFGQTKSFKCNYLSDQEERLIVVMNPEELNNNNYQFLLHNGFRRSGNQVYRPNCGACHSCESLRLPVDRFKPSKSQKRIAAYNKHFSVGLTKKAKQSYYPLYEKYINTVHKDGSMYPASQEQYNGFIFSEQIPQLFIEIYDGAKLIAVAVCDKLKDSLSALYTFYDPKYQKNSLGKFCILSQIDITQKLNLQYLYLGYQIDECPKMNYKSHYYPHQRLQNNKWLEYSKK